MAKKIAKKAIKEDLEKKGDKRMFITEQVERISLGNNGLWTVVFYTSQRIFNYKR